MWDENLTMISDLFAKSHIVIWETLSFLFDDNFNKTIISSSLPLEIFEFPHSLDLSCFLVEFDHDFDVTYSRLETSTLVLETHI